MSWRADWPGQADLPGSPLDEPEAPADPPAGESHSLFRPRGRPEARHTLRRLLGERRRAHPSPFDPVAYEEVAMSQLYGERTGTVSASPAQPPVPSADERHP